MLTLGYILRKISEFESNDYQYIQKSVYDNKEDAKTEGEEWVEESTGKNYYEIEQVKLYLNNNYKLKASTDQKGIVEIKENEQ